MYLSNNEKTLKFSLHDLHNTYFYSLIDIIADKIIVSISIT
jgi:hypothetical protein